MTFWGIAFIVAWCIVAFITLLLQDQISGWDYAIAWTLALLGAIHIFWW